MQTSIHAARAGIRNAAIRRMALWGVTLTLAFAATFAHAITLTAVQSRKAHGAAGTFDLPIDTTQNIGGAVTVEPRAIGAGHMIVFQFDVPIAATGTAAAADENGATVGTVSAAAAGNDVVVTLAGVPDNKRVTVLLSNVNGAGVDAFASLGFLVGDVNNSRSVTATDILQVKGRSGQGVDAINFKFDLNASGAITATDILAVKGRSGQVLPTALTVGGTISGLTGTVVLQNNGGSNLTLAANGPFTFPNAVANASPYNVTVLTQPAGQSCSVGNGTGTIGNANVANITITCTADTHTVGGTVSGLSGTVVLQNNGGNNLTISANGGFTFTTPVANASTYSITVLTQPAGQSCSIANGTGTIAGANIINVTVTCAANTFTVGGTVSGLSGTVVLQNNGGDNLTVSIDGAFTFPSSVVNGSPYNVTVLTQPAGQNCTVSNGSGTVAGANVANIGVSCQSSNVVFVTSTTHVANLGSAVAYDTVCTTRAAAAGLPGAYVAWISDANSNVVARLGASRGWVRSDGKPFADRLIDLTAGKVFYPLRLDEFGGAASADTPVFTGTAPDGTAGGQNCLNWTSSAGTATAGFTGAGAPSWTSLASASCNTPQRLYCFGKAQTVPVSVTPQIGRFAFVTSSTFFAGGSGLAAADAICQSEAAAAGMAGTFRALLATTTSSAASRFNTSGQTWVRSDGVPIVNTAPDIATPNLIAPLNVTAAGSYLVDHSLAWLGATSFSIVGTAASTCNNWTSTASTTPVVGFTDRTGTPFVSFFSCATPSRLFCLQQ